MINKIRRKLQYEKLVPLMYNEELQEAYMGTSVTGGELRGKLVLITGGTGGIGIAMALRFLAEECSVIICGRNTEKLENAVEYLRTKVAGAKVEYLQMDQLDNESIGRAVALLQKRSSFVYK
jgi:NAD(P)-dependent dehydrogenase (short-subunit alcohol dehydrogenase family)